MLDKTGIFNVSILKQELIMITVNDVASALEKKGYNAINQLTGYLITGDLSYITTFNNARAKLSKYSREEVMLAILNGYFGR